jgi:hypothetical protein
VDIAWHVLDCVVVFAALLAILDYFGIKRDHPFWGLRMPLNQRWKLGIMLCLVTASLVMATYAFVRAYRPKIVVTEKPVEKISERTIQLDCPIAKPTTNKHKTLPATANKDVSSSGENSPPIGSVTQGAGSAFSNNQQGGITAATINMAPPARTLSSQQKASIIDAATGVPSDVTIVIEHPTDSEASDYAKIIYDAIVGTHPNTRIGSALSYGGQPPPKGLYILGHTGDNNVLPHVNDFYLIIKDKIPCEAYQVDWVPTGTLRIGVGVMPPSVQ